jgi:glycosyltransferase involved in cell wall biosynthesis
MAARKVAYLFPLVVDERGAFRDDERLPINLARGVVESSGGDFEVEVLCFSDRPGRQQLAPGLGLRRLAIVGRPNDPLDVLSWELPGAIADADLVHIYQIYTRCAEVGLLVARQQRKPVCVTDLGGASSPLVKQLGLLDLVDRVVAVSDFGASLLRTTAPVRVVKGGVEASRFTPAASPVRREHVLFVGPLTPSKGIDRLIRALPPGLPLVVCGRPCHEEYAGLLRSLAEGKPVEFLTDADGDQLIDLYRRAWAVVLPSVHVDCYGRAHEAPEHLGLALLEAMACGTPAIASRVGGMPEYVRDGVTGFLFDTPDELTARLGELASDPNLADRLGRRGREEVERDYHHRAAGSKLAAVYGAMLGRAAGSEWAA